MSLRIPMLLIFGILLIIGLIATVTKAKWFPYPSSWLKALGLAVPFWMGAVGVFSLMSWQFIFLFILAVINRSPIPNIFLVFAAGISIASLIWYLVLILVYSLFLHLLWREVPKHLCWVKPPKSWKSTVFGWAVLTLAASVPALLLLPYSSYSFYSSSRFSEILEKLQYVEFNEEATGKMFVGWYVTAAYLYQARSLLKTRPRRTHLKNGN